MNTKPTAPPLIVGADAIAAFLGPDWTKRGVTHACRTRKLPAVKLLGQWCMRPSAYLEHLERLEAEAVER